MSGSCYAYRFDGGVRVLSDADGFRQSEVVVEA
jgi:hypothetical protein